jgi:hypothetical protein
MSDTSLPPRQPVTAESKDGGERLYRTSLSSRDYLRLEIESMERGLKPFSLNRAIMTMYINKKLIYVADLPEQLQQQINEHFKTQAQNQKQRAI